MAFQNRREQQELFEGLQVVPGFDE